MDNVRMEYYTAAWCAPCRMMVQPIAELKAAGWQIEKIDIDENQARARAAQVMSVPTFIIYKDNSPVSRFSGARQKTILENELKSAAS